MKNNQEEIKGKLVLMAENVRGEILFDLDFEINFSKFFRLKFENDMCEQMKLCSSIYKYFY